MSLFIDLIWFLLLIKNLKFSVSNFSVARKWGNRPFFTVFSVGNWLKMNEWGFYFRFSVNKERSNRLRLPIGYFEKLYSLFRARFYKFPYVGLYKGVNVRTTSLFRTYVQRENIVDYGTGGASVWKVVAPRFTRLMIGSRWSMKIENRKLEAICRCQMSDGFQSGRNIVYNTVSYTISHACTPI